ncbi:MAG: hypothetical protein C0467_06645 [Planctomycetaceae bacterium]|nr:hypothetical protein [Planctomycetaceae bacterium]
MRRGITVIALIIVLVILAIVVMLLIPVVSNVRRAAARMNCQNNLRQIGLGCHNYRDTFQVFPAGTHPGTTLPPEQRLSFYVTLLPYLECDPTYGRLMKEESWDSDTNREVPDYGRRLFKCPDWLNERGYENEANQKTGYLSVTNYVGIAGLGADAATRGTDSPGIGMFGYDRTLKNGDVKDGLANTMMLIETGYEVGPWLRGGPSTVRGIELTGGPITGDGLPFGGTHFRQAWIFQPPRPVAFHILLADASVREVRNAVDPAILAALATVAGGEVIPAGW